MVRISFLLTTLLFPAAFLLLASVEGAADGDNFGFSVAISGDGSRFAAGAPYNRAAHSDGGQVQAFDLAE